ncbi:hypothetical protein GCHA_1099 [Paraglaciecola chathamensis S18K6]|jgi:uncharacterized membrane protein YheB (UPF0754 family)|uniref:DUF445 domain-containing protein n=2 Tax=Paraglaciecola chathamensis TaxID=368405 RepID=A0AAV3UVB0_9ALTE|nr:hypothetical protein GCHA_1099 [Paraglaciecola chathamensis S18K6]
MTTVGIFALSGAVTNWLAIHMLFEKVPLLYGSGVIPQRFEEFKAGIRELMMTQFFTEQNINRFLTSGNQQLKLDLVPVLEKVDLEPTFDSLVEVINASSFGSMLGMFGGAEALTPLKQPFVEKMKTSLIEISQDERFLETLSSQLEQPNVMQDVQQKIESIVEQRLDELTPKMVKDIIQAMIKKHLGWLVVWGGVFGGLIGLITILVAS